MSRNPLYQTYYVPLCGVCSGPLVAQKLKRLRSTEINMNRHMHTLGIVFIVSGVIPYHNLKIHVQTISEVREDCLEGTNQISFVFTRVLRIS